MLEWVEKGKKGKRGKKRYEKKIHLEAGLDYLACFFSSFSWALALPLTTLVVDFLGGILW
jgi:hypothetical protein